MNLLRRMLVEEYRLHSELFGSGRFLGFPLFTTAVVAGGVWLLAETGTALTSIFAGLHLLVAFFGLQVGTLGLVGRDAMRDVLGDVTLLVFSARTLPLSWPRLLATFLLKDLLYYTAMFVTPVALGFVPLALLGEVSWTSIGLLWLTTSVTFALGAAGSLTLVGLAVRNKLLVVGVIAAGTVAVLFSGVDPLALTPYAFFTDPGVGTAVAGLAPVLVLAIAGPLLLTPTGRGGARRVRADRFDVTGRFVGGENGLAIRPLLEVARSSGSIWKVAFSLGILFAVTALLLDRVAAATGIDPSAGIAFGTLLGLGSFTTYNWLTQFDDPAEYLRYPVPLSAVFAGKLRAFVVLAMPTGIAYLVLATRWYPVADLLVGVVIFPLVSLYVFGLTTIITGLSPTELLFDTPRFAVFGGGLALLAVPLLVAALAVDGAGMTAYAGAVGLSVVAALIGLGLARRAGPRWQARLRARS